MPVEFLCCAYTLDIVIRAQHDISQIFQYSMNCFVSMLLHLVTEYDFTPDTNNDQKHLPLTVLCSAVFVWTKNYFPFLVPFNAVDNERNTTSTSNCKSF